MNRFTELDEILHEHVPRQPLEPNWISRSEVKDQCYMFCAFFVWMMRGRSRILQGRVSNPSERGTGGRAPKAPRG